MYEYVFTYVFCIHTHIYAHIYTQKYVYMFEKCGGQIYNRPESCVTATGFKIPFKPI